MINMVTFVFDSSTTVAGERERERDRGREREREREGGERESEKSAVINTIASAQTWIVELTAFSFAVGGMAPLWIRPLHRIAALVSHYELTCQPQ
jgi:hypothetical protein